MFERALNVFWILLGAGAAAHAWSIGVIGPAGPDSGLFPLIAGLLIAGAGAVLLVLPSHRAEAPEWPRRDALWRVLGVVAGLSVMAIGMQHLGFAVTGAITMMILLRTVERTSWIGSLALAIGSVAVVTWLFGRVLGMALPRGPWGW